MTAPGTQLSDRGRAVVLMGIAALALSALLWLPRGAASDPASLDGAAPTLRSPADRPAAVVRAAVDGGETVGDPTRGRAWHAIPVDDVADLERLSPSTALVTEGDHYRDLRALAATDLSALDALIPTVLEGDAPDCRRVALLRVLFDLRSPAAADAFARSIRHLPESTSGSRGDSVPGFAVTFLSKHAAREPIAREVLERVAFERNGSPSDRLRRRAAAAFAAAADGPALERLPMHVARELDPALISGVTAALAGNPHVRAVDQALSRMGSPLPDRSIRPSPER